MTDSQRNGTVCKTCVNRRLPHDLPPYARNPPGHETYDCRLFGTMAGGKADEVGCCMWEGEGVAA